MLEKKDSLFKKKKKLYVKKGEKSDKFIVLHAKYVQAINHHFVEKS